MNKNKLTNIKSNTILKNDAKKIEKQYRKNENNGHKLIKSWVEQYTKTKYPTVNEKLLEKLGKGLRLLNYNYVALPEDDVYCVKCKFKVGKVGKALSLKTHFGMGVMCHYCSVESQQSNILQHTPSECKHPSRKEIKDDTRMWAREDCELFIKSFESSYKKILKEIAK